MLTSPSYRGNDVHSTFFGETARISDDVSHAALQDIEVTADGSFNPSPYNTRDSTFRAVLRREGKPTLASFIAQFAGMDSRISRTWS